MAVAASRYAHERGFARSHLRRSPQAGISTSASVVPSATATPDAAAAARADGVSGFPPDTIKALIGVIVVLGIFLSGEYWRISIPRDEN